MRFADLTGADNIFECFFSFYSELIRVGGRVEGLGEGGGGVGLTAEPR